MSEVTRILSAAEQGDSHAADQLLPLVYDELRKLAAQKLAHEKPGQSLQATALVHEAYVRLVGAEQAQNWISRGHFFAAAAVAMRRILVERARSRASLKRGGGRQRLELEDIPVVPSERPDDPTAGTSQPVAAQLWSFGTCEQNKRWSYPATTATLIASCTLGTACGWRRRVTTTPYDSGTQQPANSSGLCAIIKRGSLTWLSARTAASSRPPAGTGPCGSGTSPRAPRSAY